jgi:putative acetyltransferase
MTQHQKRASSLDIRVVSALQPAELVHAHDLFQAYATSLSIGLGVQDFARELETLPGDYVAPRGALVLAYVVRVPAGCYALRAIDSTDYANACEIKRLCVAPAFRGLGLGRKLTEPVLEQARLSNYDGPLLDGMEAAWALYQDLGFEEIPPYHFSPIAGANYLKVAL